MNRSIHDRRRPAGLPGAAVDRCLAGLRWLGFWLAVSLPAVYALAFLARPGGPALRTLAAVVAVHVVALALGSGHNRSTDEGAAADPSEG